MPRPYILLSVAQSIDGYIDDWLRSRVLGSKQNQGSSPSGRGTLSRPCGLQRTSARAKAGPGGPASAASTGEALGDRLPIVVAQVAEPVVERSSAAV